MTLDPAIAARLKRDADGLVCAVAQQRGTGEVLMVAWMDDEALHRTLTTGRATYWSRSRQEYWVKGDTSGNVQKVHEVRLPVWHAGPAWSTTTRSASPSQSSRTSWTFWTLPEVSPLTQYSRRERDQ